MAGVDENLTVQRVLTRTALLVAAALLAFTPLSVSADPEADLENRINQFTKFLIEPLEAEQSKLHGEVASIEKLMKRTDVELAAAKALLQKHEAGLRAAQGKVEHAKSRLPELLTHVPTPLSKRSPYDPYGRRKMLDLKDWLRKKARGAAEWAFGFSRSVGVTRGMSRAERDRLLSELRQAKKAQSDLVRQIDAELGGAKVKGLKGLVALITKLEERRNALEIERASVRADIYRNDESLRGYRESLAKLMAELEELRKKKKTPKLAPLAEGEVWFVEDLHLPTPRGAVEIPVELEVYGSYGPSHSMRFRRMFLNDPTAAAYVALFQGPAGEKAEQILERFTQLGEAFNALKSAAYSNRFQSGALRHGPGAAMYRIDLAGNQRYWFTHGSDTDTHVVGRPSFYGLKPGRHEARVVVVTEDGRRLEGTRELLVKTNRKGGIAAARAEAKALSENCRQAQAAPAGESRVYLSQECMRGLRRAFAILGESSGCTTADLDGVLAKEAVALGELVGSPFWQKSWGTPFPGLREFADHCRFVGTEQAYQRLSAIASATLVFADGDGGKPARAALDNLYRSMADISLQTGRWTRALQDLKRTSIGTEAWWPTFRHLEQMGRELSREPR